MSQHFSVLVDDAHVEIRHQDQHSLVAVGASDTDEAEPIMTLADSPKWFFDKLLQGINACESAGRSSQY